jgi:hypothetical protein
MMMRSGVSVVRLEADVRQYYGTVSSRPDIVTP